MDFTKQTVLITGGGSGIGLALAKLFNEAGSRVIIASRNIDNDLVSRESLDNSIIFTCDLTDKTSVVDLKRKLEDENIHISVLVNNAGVQFYPRLTDNDFEFDNIELEVTTNFTAVVWLSSLFLPDLLKQASAAAIINISSGLACFPKTSSAVYSATKAAVHNFSQSLRYQLEGTAVTVHEVMLPLVDTAMTRERDTKKISPQQAAQGIFQGFKKGKTDIFVGKAGLLPIMSRLVPGILKKILKNN